MTIETQLKDLDRLAARARNVLSDARKAKWHADTREQLQQIEAEISRLEAREPSRKPPVLSERSRAPHTTTGA